MTTPRVTVPVDELAQEIRRVDGNHDLGAGALAEALMPFLSSRLSAAPAPEGGAVKKACVDFQEAIDDFEAEVADVMAEGSERADLWDREIMVNIDALKTVMNAALATREEAPAEAGVQETLRVLLDNLVIAQSLSKELRQRATDEARSYLSALRAQPPAREDGGDRPIEASWTDGVTHAYVNLSAALSAERQAWRQKLGIRIASVRYLDVEVPPAREDALPVAKVVRLGFSKGGISFTSAGNEADLPDGTPLFTRPAPDALRVAVEALDAITDLSVNLRHGGPDSMDLHGLSEALSSAIDIAYEALAALQAEQKGGAA